MAIKFKHETTLLEKKLMEKVKKLSKNGKDQQNWNLFLSLYDQSLCSGGETGY